MHFSTIGTLLRAKMLHSDRRHNSAFSFLTIGIEWSCCAFAEQAALREIESEKNCLFEALPLVFLYNYYAKLLYYLFLLIFLDCCCLDGSMARWILDLNNFFEH
jgi:hypothetical protein